jgi:RimJ/RimL family protein N-acetyltransferase
VTADPTRRPAPERPPAAEPPRGSVPRDAASEPSRAAVPPPSEPGDVPPIPTPRFELVSMSLAFMRLLRAGDLAGASREMGVAVPTDLREGLVDFLNYRIPALEADPGIRPWIGRVIVATAPDGSRQGIGTIGFHGPPDEHGRVEIGYGVQPAWRRQGVATECVAAMLAWAEARGITRFRASVAPGNEPSLAIIRRLGFRQVGSQIDDIDGLELVFDLDH